MKARTVTYRGAVWKLPDLAKKTGVPISTIASRLANGWSVEDAADTPPHQKFNPRPQPGRPRLDGPRPCPAMTETADGRAWARWREAGRRRVKYFGPWGSADSRTAYAAFVAEWAARHGVPPPDPKVRLTVAGLALRVREWADGYYRKDGKKTSETYAYRAALNILSDLYGPTPAADFAPERLRATVAKMVADGLSRGTCNEYRAKIIKAFSWAAGRSLIPPAVPDALRHVETLAAGRTAAHDPAPVTDVDPAVVEATLPHLHADPGRRAVLEAMIRVQIATGVRPGELCAMRPEMFDCSSPPWLYDPRRVHKNFHRGKGREVWIGPRGRAALAPHLAVAAPGDRVWRFPPRRKDGTRTPVSRVWFARYLLRACKRAGVKSWHPHQLRHNRATEVMDIYECDEAAAKAIGDTPEVARQVYAHRAGQAAAKRIAEETG